MIIALNDAFVRDNKSVLASVWSASINSAFVIVIANIVGDTLNISSGVICADSFLLAWSWLTFLLAKIWWNASSDGVESTQSGVGVTVNSLAIL